MSTWHQNQNPVKLYHETLWTVVEDAPNGHTSVTRFKDPVQAQRMCDLVNKHHPKRAYVLPPEKK